MAQAKSKKVEADKVELALVSWDSFDTAEKIDIELKNGLKLEVEGLTGRKVLQIAKVVGGKIVEIMEGTTEDMPLQKLIDLALEKLDDKALEDVAEAVFSERRVLNLPADVLADLVKQYVDKVGIKEVFSAVRTIGESIKNG